MTAYVGSTCCGKLPDGRRRVGDQGRVVDESDVRFLLSFDLLMLGVVCESCASGQAGAGVRQQWRMGERATWALGLAYGGTGIDGGGLS